DNMIMALGKSSIKIENKPQIMFDQEKVTLKWTDEEETVISNFDLRLSCKCARCIDEMSGRQILKKNDIIPDIKAEEVHPLGNYAIAVKWNDGHSSGIYPYRRIKEMASRRKLKTC
ncbi:MAG: DUF971 domain-containing protein, partial [Nitrospinota bacterium]